MSTTRPNYYRPTRENPRIAPDADVTDFLHAFGVDSHGLGECIAKIVRSGRKDGESPYKELTKALEHLRRHIELTATGPDERAPEIRYPRGLQLGSEVTEQNHTGS